MIRAVIREAGLRRLVVDLVGFVFFMTCLLAGVLVVGAAVAGR